MKQVYYNDMTQALASVIFIIKVYYMYNDMAQASASVIFIIVNQFYKNDILWARM